MEPIQARVQLRVEGANQTLFEDFVLTKAHNISKPPGETHPCDGTNNNANPLPGPTVLSALDDASLLFALPWNGTWTPSLDDYLVTSISGEVPQNQNGWGLYLNYKIISVGGSQQYTRDLDEVLFANDAFANGTGTGKPTLKLTGPRRTRVNTNVTLTVKNGATGENVANATVRNIQTNAAGEVTIQFNAIGSYIVKANKDGFIRSNGLKMEVSA